MSGKDGDGNTIVQFDVLDQEGGDDSPPQKFQEVLTLLESKLDAEDYNDVLDKLGLSKDLSNREVLDRIETLLQKKDDEYEYPEKEKQAAYKDFMEKCMKEGKTMKECAEAFKKEYPGPEKKKAAQKKEDEDEEEEEKKAAKKDEEEEEEEDKKMKALMDRIEALEGQLETMGQVKETAVIESELSKLVNEMHLAPAQKELAMKLAAKYPEADRAEFFDFFRKTQKFNVSTDVGRTTDMPPGSTAGGELTPERKQELIKLHGLEGLIEDKADKTKLPWKGNN